MPLRVFPDGALLARLDRAAPERWPLDEPFRPVHGFAWYPAPEADPVVLGWWPGGEQSSTEVGGERQGESARTTPQCLDSLQLDVVN